MVTKQCEMDLNAALGGVYVMEDGRTFWVDHATVREMLRRILPVVGAEAERHYLNGTRNPNRISEIVGGA
jgi:hypothetical protein